MHTIIILRHSEKAVLTLPVHGNLETHTWHFIKFKTYLKFQFNGLFIILKVSFAVLLEKAKVSSINYKLDIGSCGVYNTLLPFLALKIQRKLDCLSSLYYS